jgi:hypothetical protein
LYSTRKEPLIGRPPRCTSLSITWVARGAGVQADRDVVGVVLVRVVHPEGDPRAGPLVAVGEHLVAVPDWAGSKELTVTSPRVAGRPPSRSARILGSWSLIVRRASPGRRPLGLGIVEMESVGCWAGRPRRWS